jgi:hypothetical protein
MILNASNCPSFESKITWFINKEGNFVLKILDENKARKVTEEQTNKTGRQPCR